MAEGARRVWKALLVTALMVVAWHPIEEVDVFFHLELGEAVLRHGSRLVPEPSAFTDYAPLCVVPAWLWDISAYGLYKLGGVNALLAATVLLAGILAWSICFLVERLEARRSLAAFVWVSGMASVCVSHRLQVRPQVAFFLTLAGFMALCFAYRGTAGSGRAFRGASIVALAVFWAQIHGSVVLAPVVFALMVVESAWAGRDDPYQRRVDLLVLAGVLASLATGSSGFDVLKYVTTHAGDDIARHNMEMAAVDWSSVAPFGPPIAGGLLGIWLPAIAGVRDRDGWHLPEVLLALLGVYLFSNVLRFSSTAALLAIPLAVKGACQLAEAGRTVYRRRESWIGVTVAAALAIALLWRRGEEAYRTAGPFPHGGWTSGAHPRAAAEHLSRRLPAGSNVLTQYVAGPPLAFWAGDHLRTFVDGRTAMYFDATDFALSRELFRHEEALWRGIQRYRAGAVVVRRTEGICQMLGRKWVPAVIEPRYSTFVAPGLDRPMEGLLPCGDQLIADDLCSNGARGPSETADRLQELGQPAFADQLRAAVLLRCRGDAARALARLPRDTAVWESRDENRRLRIEAQLLTGRVENAVAAMHRALQENDSGVIRVLGSPGAKRLNPAQKRGFLERALKGLDDQARPGLRLALALVCQQQQDAECVRFQALRAAARGDERSLPFLRWLSEHHPVPRVRSEAREWQQTFR